MDARKATYLRGGTAHWQSGVAMLEQSDRLVTPTLIPMHPDGSFVYDIATRTPGAGA